MDWNDLFDTYVPVFKYFQYWTVLTVLWFLKPVWPDNNEEEDSEGTNEEETKHS